MEVEKNLKSAKKFLVDVIAFVAVVGSALMMWNVAKLVTHTESPIVVVLTGSMEPAFYRGDLLLVTHFPEDLRSGDIIVFKGRDHPIPIVHRALVIQVKQDQPRSASSVKVQLLDKLDEFLSKNPMEEHFYLLTKGDANPVNDRGLYTTGQLWLSRDELIGKVRAYCPYVGYLTIVLNENPPLKYTVLGAMLLSVMLAKDQKDA
jgi:signal peptidase